MSGKHLGPQIVPADAVGIAAAAARIAAGDAVAVSTETVYGLAARADSPEAVAAIYAAKGRPGFNPLIVHVSDLAQAEAIALFDARARHLAEKFWPGPLTLVLPLKEGARIAPAVTAGLPTIALRCPAHPVMRAVLEASGLPLAAPSANRSGGVSPTSAQHVAQSLAGQIAMVLDGGDCPAGLESTIVALRKDGTWQQLRPGPVPHEDLVAELGSENEAHDARGIEAPGQLASHYAPGKPVRLSALAAEPDEFLIGFGSLGGDYNLSPGGDLLEAATRLYAALHEAAAAPQPRIAVAALPEHGLGAALNDRLRRAAA